MSQPLQDKVALVTGATHGLGSAISRELAKQGAHIIALGRTTGALEELDDQIRKVGSKATLLPMDLTETERLDNLGPTLFARFDHLDILIANAGYLGTLSPLPHISTEEWQKVITTNLTANWQLIRTLDPLLQKAQNPKAVFITDALANQPEAYWGPYSAAKAGLEALVKTYAAETETNNIDVNLYDPGPMATGLRRKAYPGEDQSGLQTAEQAAEKLLNELLADQ